MNQLQKAIAASLLFIAYWSNSSHAEIVSQASSYNQPSEKNPPVDNFVDGQILQASKISTGFHNHHVSA